jgi:hypothetical protein
MTTDYAILDAIAAGFEVTLILLVVLLVRHWFSNE